MKNNFREFIPSSWAIDNRVAIFILTAIITAAGLISYQLLPKENFPEIQWPVIFVSTPYPGTSAGDIENLVSRKIEKELKGLEGIKEINSTSIQDFSSVFVEFETDVDLAEAKREVQEAVNRVKGELPNDLPGDPQVIDINLSEIPIMFLNVSGPYDNVTLKRYSEELQDEIEKLKEILRVDIVGAPEKEIQINVDLFKAEAASVTMSDIEQTIRGENIIVSGGELDIDQQKVSVRINGEFKSIEEIRNIVVRSGKGNIVYLRDVANVVDGFKEKDSYARLNGQPVLTLNIIKKAGENLVDAADQIKVITAEMKEKRFPENLTITLSADQSQLTRNTLGELTNTIIIGFILVTVVLMFFMGLRDSLFVGLAIPLSSFIAFAILPALGYTMNLVVLFSFILALGIVVDNAIVVIENTYRMFTEENLPIVTAAKKAAGEVIGPVFSGTLTTVCPFLPLLFWKGPVGEFMGFMPVVMIITLFASLFVAYIINPVFAVTFMKRSAENEGINHKQIWLYTGLTLVSGIILRVAGAVSFGNFMFFMTAFVLLHNYVLVFVIKWFQGKVLPAIKNFYRQTLRWSLDHTRFVVFATIAFLVLTMVFVSSAKIKYIQFPPTDPNFAYVFNELPSGTDIEVTDSITRILEERVYEVIGKDNPMIRSVITNVAIGAGDPNSFDQSTSKTHKSKITVEFVGVKERNGASTQEILDKIRANTTGIPGTKITVEQDQNGPPGSAPIEVQVTSEDFAFMMDVSEDLFAYLDSLSNAGSIAGLERIKWDVDEKRPELIININREKARELGLSSGQIGMELRTAIFGKEISNFRANEDEFKILLRLDEKYREEISTLLNMRITYMDMATGRFRSVPISSVADFSYSSNYGGINRTDLKKSVRITSNVLSEYNVNDVFNEVDYAVQEFVKQDRKMKEVDITVGGQTEDMAEEGAFLGGAFAAAILLIFLILVTQFNSLSSVLIIMSQVLLSIVGVFLGHAVIGMDFSVVLSGVGIVTLAGIVVNNGIILLDFFNQQIAKGVPLKEAIIEGGAIRFTPVFLTASSTVLGLVPLAISLNINFGTLLSDFDPQIFFGGDSASFWEPFSWSIIFGLTFATVVTLVIVPVLFYMMTNFEASVARRLRLNVHETPTEVLPEPEVVKE
ncbi:MAG: efflux RND transporter permease subunit [Bacteroidia bacterium]|nr:efflux RND transporter permease subunit [Bacteroidia bacterium]